MEFTVIKHETSTSGPRKTPTYKYTEEFISNFNQLWEALKGEHYLTKLSIKFATKEERNKFLRYAKAYGETKGISVSNADVEETKDTPRLNIRMELTTTKVKRAEERKARAELIAEYKKLGGNPDYVKRGTSAPEGFNLKTEVDKLRKAAEDKAKAPQGKPQTQPHAKPQVPAKK